MTDLIASDARASVTWVGHSTMLLDLDGFRVLTDPLLTARVVHLRRRRPLPASEIGDVDLVLLSHAHMDHLHLPSLRLVRPSATVVTPVGAGPLLRRAGFADVREVREGDSVAVGPVTVVTVPAAHRHGRGPHSRVEASPVGFVVESPAGRHYFAGDTDLFAGMADLGELDVALLPIWGWGPSVGVGHLDPPRAVDAVELLRPRLVVPMHWGTYAPEDGRRRLPSWFHDPVERFAALVEDADEGAGLRVVEPGASVDVSR